MSTPDTTNAGQSGQVNKTMELVLSKTVKGKPVLPSPQAKFTIQWDLSKSMGQASLVSLDGITTNIVLHPLGIQGELAFMSSTKPTTFHIDGKEVVISRVILDATSDLSGASAAIMFNQDGSTLQVSANWSEDKAALKQHLKHS